MSVVVERRQVSGGDGAIDLSAYSIRPLQTEADRKAFRLLNEEWIAKYFVLEARDREILDNPDREILSRGGHIYMAEAGIEVIGCVALIPMNQGIYELSKMAVSPRYQGLGIGRQLLKHAIQEATAFGAGSLFLGSSKKLKNAVHLYESVGFRHVPPDKIPPMPYTRADVFMDLPLTSPE